VRYDSPFSRPEVSASEAVYPQANVHLSSTVLRIDEGWIGHNPEIT